MIIEVDQLNSCIQTFFNPQWYVQQYPDVAQAGVDPWTHYIQFGQAEGRFPCHFNALQLDDALWFNNDIQSIVALKAYTDQASSLVKMPLKARVNLFLAHWALARWYAAQGQSKRALSHLDMWLGAEDAGSLDARLLALKIVGHLGPVKLWFSLLRQEESRIAEAASLLEHLIWAKNTLQLSLTEQAEISDRCLAKTSLLDTSGASRLAELNTIFSARNLIALTWREQSNTLLDDLGAESFQTALHPRQTMFSKVWNWLMPERFQKVPLISVIVPCFNASQHILTTLNSLYAQTWQRIEVLVVDDASTDDSASLVENFINHSESRTGLRLRLIRQAKNQGAYAARNEGMRQARGRLLTVHDSDDWSHPQKIELQARRLLDNKAASASISHWVRCTSDLIFGRWRAEPTWVYPNVSSLMIRRQVLKRIGYWDLVSVNADSEYIDRLKAVYGADAVSEVLPGVPLSFGRHDDGSLSQHSKTHLRTQFFGVRRDYMTIAREWHKSQIAKNKSLYLPATPDKRAFPVPPMIFRGSEEMYELNLENWLKESEFFDAAYYLDRYSDVAQAGVDPYRHYVANGETEGRDPSALFSSSGYRAARSVTGAPLSADQYALHEAAKEGLTVAAGSAASRVVFNYVKALPEPDSSTTARPSKPWMAVCGHSAQGQAFGAENSLLDVLEALQQEWQIVLVLPQALAADYISKLSVYVDVLVVFPYQWWHQQREANSITQAAFVRLFNEYSVKVVYANTLTLDEPLRAAKSMGLPVAVHVRELLRDDPGLLATLGLKDGNCRPLMSFLAANANLLIANSETLAEWLENESLPTELTCVHKRIEVVPNCVRAMSGKAVSELSLPFVRTGSQARLQVGMFSSNLPKKGLYDFFELAASLADCADFHLYGPFNEHTAKLSGDNSSAPNVKLHGYVDNISKEMAGLDVVVNLSHFAESFGRSILEAMAAGKIVASYRHGALPELIADAGLMVEKGNVLAMSEALRELMKSPEKAVELASKSSKRAALYTFEPYAAKLRKLLRLV